MAAAVHCDVSSLIFCIGTFKHQKVELRNQGIEPTKCLSNGKLDALFMYVASPHPSTLTHIYIHTEPYTRTLTVSISPSERVFPICEVVCVVV